ncbi:hypothetical protein [Micromonospora sp. NPDC047730]|uniref:hypothetical protein n=1 Tax=Micromonospora sp. NPDC047730 TaxID=3364253 RepID=UPI0037159B11
MSEARLGPHVLVVSEVDGKRWHVIECPGVTDACRAWVDCPQRDEEHNDDALEDDPVAHGVEHRWIDGDWMVRTDDCLVRTHMYAGEIAAELNLPPGRHPVGHDFGDGTEYELSVLDPAGAVP